MLTASADPVATAREWLELHARKRPTPNNRIGSNALAGAIGRWADEPISSAHVCAAARALGFVSRPLLSGKPGSIFNARLIACSARCTVRSSAPSRAGCAASRASVVGEGSTPGDLVRVAERATTLLARLVVAVERIAHELERRGAP